jgi:Tfp pilus assembly protein PilV
MKAQLVGNKLNKGVATLEVLIAFAILIICISGVILVTFSNQSIAIDSEINNEAVSKAQNILENARANSRNNYGAIQDCDDDPSSSMPACFGISDYPFYNRTLAIDPASVTNCGQDIKSTTTWELGGRTLNIDFVTRLGDMATALALGGDCVINPSGSDWNNPGTYTTGDINPSGNKGTGIDVMRVGGSAYAFLTSKHNSSASEDFWVFDVDSLPYPPPVGLNTGQGLNGIDVAKDSVTGEFYAYVLQDSNTDQLLVLRVTSPLSSSIVANRTLPNINYTCSPVSSPCLAGKSIFYFDGKVYIGTNYLAFGLPNENHELHIYCVTPDPDVPGCSASSPTNPVWLGSYNVNHNVDSIFVTQSSGNISAYLATSGNNQELAVIDVTDPVSAAPLPFFDALGTEDGTSVELLGNKIFFGRAQTSTSRPELYVLNKADLSILASTDLGLSPAAAEVMDITAVSNFIFLGTSDSNAEFQVWKQNDLSSRWSFFNFPQAVTGIEFFEDKIYSSVDSNSALRVIYDTTP